MVLLKSVTMLAAGIMIAAAAASAQPPTLKDGKKDKDDKSATVKQDKVLLPAPSSTADPSPTPATGEAAADKQLDDEILPYYKNFLKEYRLGPGDQVTVEVFGQCPEYCKSGITVPPNARISYPLIRDGIFVAGRTIDQVAAEITKKLDEYIIDPKVTVTLDKAVATRYSVMGNVATPGVRVMDRKVSVYEAVLDAGGVTKDGNKKQVAVVSYGKDGRLARRVVNLEEMEAGKADMVYLEPGDQVFVTGKGFTLSKVLDYMSKASMLRYMAPL
ncbi:MAG: polysaccharide biosynthesis/export family protein [Pyrinomonadaceae bacterium]